ncbi:hypothetical protein VCUG_02359 [Vavraia culicis subsp. floridensis]|uniref:RNA helicase n=1 Tax=Vavraia culicis (isolate floridensis) TaxID=948595 RepID=L2GRZ3_VAVCU|nr:uncharacterized protein VCUG_02359 [Vavraia culicis subsp. floridensis]ELA46157.1 hypothetical protein VCUG_02359 [Vavraia culicis subsp. floridensis]
MKDTSSDKKKSDEKNSVYVFKNTKKYEESGGTVNGYGLNDRLGGSWRGSTVKSSREWNKKSGHEETHDGSKYEYKQNSSFNRSDKQRARDQPCINEQLQNNKNSINAHKTMIDNKEGNGMHEIDRDCNAVQGSTTNAVERGGERKTFSWRTEKEPRDGRTGNGKVWYEMSGYKSGSKSINENDGCKGSDTDNRGSSGVKNRNGDHARDDTTDISPTTSGEPLVGNEDRQRMNYAQGKGQRTERNGRSCWKMRGDEDGLNGQCGVDDKERDGHVYRPVTGGNAHVRSGAWRLEGERNRKVWGEGTEEGNRSCDDRAGPVNKLGSRSDGGTFYSPKEAYVPKINGAFRGGRYGQSEGDRYGETDRTKPGARYGQSEGDRYGETDRTKPGARYGQSEGDRYGKRSGAHSYRTHTSSTGKGRSKQFVFPSTYKTTEEYVITSSHPFMRINTDGKIKYNTLQRYAMHYIGEGKHMILRAPTGTGKTLTYLLPIVSNIEKVFVSQRVIKLLVVVPTRELAAQIVTEVNKISNLSVKMVIGGGEYGMDGNVVVATPGRLIDTLSRYYRYNRSSAGGVHPLLAQLSAVVLDEGDTMFDLGFKHDIASILSQAHRDVQLVVASATYNKGIMECIRDWRCDWVYLCFEMDGMVEQKVVLVMDKFKELVRVIGEYCGGDDRKGRRFDDGLGSREMSGRYGGREQNDAFGYGNTMKYRGCSAAVVESPAKEQHAHANAPNDVCKKEQNNKILVFVKRKRTVDVLANSLPFMLTSLHGSMPQHQRTANLALFHANVNILVATSIAARGLHIQNVNLVINYDLPDNIDEYVHRIGRTGRGKKGTSISFWNGDLLGKYLAKYLEHCGCDVPGFLKGERVAEHEDVRKRFEMMRFADEKSGDSEEGWDDFVEG